MNDTSSEIMVSVPPTGELDPKLIFLSFENIFERTSIFHLISLFLQMAEIGDSSVANHRLKAYKNKALDSYEMRRRREEEGIQLRKQKREEQVSLSQFAALLLMTTISP